MHVFLLLLAALPTSEAWQAVWSAHPATRASAIVAKVGDVPQEELAKKYDLVVVGGGPAGVAGALRGAYQGKRVLLVDKPKMAPPGGGVDPFFGGPTGLFSKALRDASKTLDVNSLSAMGLHRDVIFKQVQTMCLTLARNNALTQAKMLAHFKVGYCQGEASLEPVASEDGEAVAEPVRLTVRPHAAPESPVALACDKLLVCTGSYPMQPPGIPFDGKQVFDSDTINAGLSFLPKSVVLIGSGIIAIEYAKIFRKLGADVTMVVRGNALAALERIGLDETIAERLLCGLREDDVTIYEDTVISDYAFGTDSEGEYECDIETEFAAEDEGVRPIMCTLQRKSDGADVATLPGEIVLACLGRKPRTPPSLGLVEAGVELVDGGYVSVDSFSESTSRPGVYAAGDCTEGPALASTGVDQAQRAVEAMWDGDCDDVLDGECEKVVERPPFPIGMWTIPEIGYYGLTLKAALAEGYDADVRRHRRAHPRRCDAPPRPRPDAALRHAMTLCGSHCGAAGGRRHLRRVPARARLCSGRLP
jgi:pyruvate/2-oxoglutarate dehydrogenase complex dihydrolipoamide dehydrogenase (E3) component